MFDIVQITIELIFRYLIKSVVATNCDLSYFVKWNGIDKKKKIVVELA